MSHSHLNSFPPLDPATDLDLLPLPSDSSGQVYQSTVPLQNPGGDRGAAALPLPHSLLLRLPVGVGRLEAASAQVLDESHLAVVGVPHPSAGAGKGKSCLEALSRVLGLAILLSCLSDPVLSEIQADITDTDSSTWCKYI